MAVTRASVADIDVIAWPVVRPGSLATFAGCWQCSEPTTSRARVALLHFLTATGSTFAFRQGGPSKVISLLQDSRLAATSISISIHYSRVSFCAPSEACFSDLVAERMGDWEKELSVWSWLPLQWLWWCVSLWRKMRWTRNEFEEGMSTFVSTYGPALLWHLHSTWQRLEDSRNALVKLWLYVVSC